ncbi:MAG: hypothetical protein C0190_00645 [Thermodesulfobacterium geofontis]|uniref:Flavodoxin-like domain-containing protein n=1 Tax=Thermodesulfobacterium geofontis TaxID=1295609 RepID=A0A2N7Q7Y1_9BACT|nr:MAG: hypothetical protein C0190_00645 [Thermodesulfobacterium geofontis]PMP94277.1 MAG: hypothetical protein C0169_06715 [Thermodesulfobacterium geofontis]
MDIYYFSYTGTSKEIAEWLSKKFNLKPKEIRTYKFPYLIWLFLSFIPYLPFKATFEPPFNDTIILCFPKWTFNCPPITYFLKKIRCRKLILIISYKGWGKKLYEHLYLKLASKVAKEIKITFIKQKLWKRGIYKNLESEFYKFVY